MFNRRNSEWSSSDIIHPLIKISKFNLKYKSTTRNVIYYYKATTRYGYVYNRENLCAHMGLYCFGKCREEYCFMIYSLFPHFIFIKLSKLWRCGCLSSICNVDYHFYHPFVEWLMNIQLFPLCESMRCRIHLYFYFYIQP